MIDTPVIFLNGTSSSGKTSIARELQKRLAKVYCVWSRDVFDSLFPSEIWDNNELMKDIGPNIYLGFHKAIATYASSGNYIIIDHILNRFEWPYECADAFDGVNAMFVGVKCPIDIAKKRERDRGDRKIGLVESQIDIVHAHDVYDLVVDTSLCSVSECVENIISRMGDGEYTAFKKLRQESRSA